MASEDNAKTHGTLFMLVNLSSLLQLGFITGYPEQDVPLPSVDGTTNYLGASIFIGYIVAALILTGRIIFSLQAQYEQVRQRRKDSEARDKGLGNLIILAILSFSVLSYNMLSFLILSYQEWCQARHLVISNMCVIDMLSSIWQWTVTSTLFLDFARSLCRTQAGYWWVMQGLMSTMVTNIVMSSMGQQYAIRNLSLYFLIGQILPISFAQNLFSIALVLAAAAGQGTKAHGKRYISGRSLTTPALYIIIILYRIMLDLLPRTSSTSPFIFLVLVTRLLLAAVTLITFTKPSLICGSYLKGLMSSVQYGLLCISAGRILLRFTSASWFQSSSLQFDALLGAAGNPAMRAIGIDVLLWILSFKVLLDTSLVSC